jgi:hypothetical protein
LPEDLFEIIGKRRLGFRHSEGSGVLFHMIGALSQYGKIGMTCCTSPPPPSAKGRRRTPSCAHRCCATCSG